jgi:hypothetical protein
MPYLHETRHKGDITLYPVRNIAFAEEWLETGGLDIIFVGADFELLTGLFDHLTGAGLMQGYRLRDQHPPRYATGVVYDRITCTVDGYNDRMLSVESLAVIIERWIRQHVRAGRIERYTIDDLLNLTGCERHLALNLHADADDANQNQDPMANIYLKVPWYVACFFRGRDEDRQVTEWEPVKFASFDHEYQLMINTLRNIPEQNQSYMCYSQHAWNNVLKGRCPDGSLLIMNRERTKWPDASETATLTGVKRSNHHNASDYLCIEMPREVWVNNRTCRTNACYSMTYDAARQLASTLMERFCYEYTQWFINDQRNARAHGFKRKKNESVERFLVQYNFPVIIEPRLRESLRRQHSRLFSRGMGKPKNCLQFNHSFLEHISEDDLKRIEAAKKKENGGV